MNQRKTPKTQTVAVPSEMGDIVLARKKLAELADLGKKKPAPSVRSAQDVRNIRDLRERILALHGVAESCLNSMLEKGYTDRIPYFARLLSNAVDQAKNSYDSQLIETALDEFTQFYTRHLNKDAMFQGILVPATNLKVHPQTGLGERDYDLEGFLELDFSRAFNHVTVGGQFSSLLKDARLYPKVDFVNEQQEEVKNELDNHRQLLKSKDGNHHNFEPLFDSDGNPFPWAESLTWESPFDIHGDLKPWIIKMFQDRNKFSVNNFCKQAFQLAYKAVCDQNGKLSNDVQDYFGRNNVSAVVDKTSEFSVKANLVFASIQCLAAALVEEKSWLKLFLNSIGGILDVQGKNLSQCAGELTELRKKLISKNYSESTLKAGNVLYLKFDSLLNSILQNGPKHFELIPSITKLISQANSAMALDEARALTELNRIQQTIEDDSQLFTINCRDALERLKHFNDSVKYKKEIQKILDEYQTLYNELFELKRFEQIAELTHSIQETTRILEQAIAARRDKKEQFNLDAENNLDNVIQDQSRGVIRLRCRHALRSLEAEISADPENYVNRRVGRDVLVPSREILSRLDNPRNYKEVSALSNAVFKAAGFVKKQDVNSHNAYMQAATQAVTNASKETKKWWTKWAGRGLMVVGGLALAAIAGISIAATCGASLGVLAAIAVTAKITASAAAAVTASSVVTMAGVALTEAGEDSKIQKRFRLFGNVTQLPTVTQKGGAEVANPLSAFLIMTGPSTANDFCEDLLKYTDTARELFLIDELKKDKKNKFLNKLFDSNGQFKDQIKSIERNDIEAKIKQLTDSNANQFISELAKQLKIEPKTLFDEMQFCYGVGSEEMAEKRHVLMQNTLSQTKIEPIQALLFIAYHDKYYSDLFTSRPVGSGKKASEKEILELQKKQGIISSMQHMLSILVEQNKDYAKMNARSPDFDQIKGLFDTSLQNLTVHALDVVLRHWVKNHFEDDNEQQTLQKLIDAELLRRVELAPMRPSLKGG